MMNRKTAEEGRALLIKYATAAQTLEATPTASRHLLEPETFDAAVDEAIASEHSKPGDVLPDGALVTMPDGERMYALGPCGDDDTDDDEPLPTGGGTDQQSFGELKMTDWRAVAESMIDALSGVYEQCHARDSGGEDYAVDVCHVCHGADEHRPECPVGKATRIYTDAAVASHSAGGESEETLRGALEFARRFIDQGRFADTDAALARIDKVLQGHRALPSDLPAHDAGCATNRGGYRCDCRLSVPPLREGGES